MKGFLVFGLMLIFLSGCGTGTFQVPKREYQSKVQVLGVLPLLVDRQARLDYPHKEALYDLLERSNQGKHEHLVALLKKEKAYFDVRAISAGTEMLQASLRTNELPRNKSGRPEGYQLASPAAAELSRLNVVDALLVVVFSGAKVEETRRSRTLLESLKTSYEDIVVTATVIDSNGNILWKMAGDDSFQAVTLQYADFDEAYYNKTDLVRLKDISFSGIEPLVAGKADSKGQKELPALYRDLFETIVSGISPGLLDGI